MANVVQKKQVAAFNVDSYNRMAVCEETIENGCVFKLENYSDNPGEGIVWKAEAPTTANDAGLWMATSPEVPIVSVSSGATGPNAPEDLVFAGIVKDPRFFVNNAGRMIDCIFLKEGDILEMTCDTIADVDTNEYLVPTAGQFKLTATAAAGTGLSLRKLGTSILHIGSAGMVKGFPVTYKYVVESN